MANLSPYAIDKQPSFSKRTCLNLDQHMPSFLTSAPVSFSTSLAKKALAAYFFSLFFLGITLPFAASPANAQTSGNSQHGKDYVYKDDMEEEPEIRMTRCQRLERQLANIYIRGNSTNGPDQIAAISQKIALESKNYRKLKRQAERKNCYENTFFFGKEVRRTRYCIRLDRRIRQSKEVLRRLDDNRRNLRRPRNNTARRDALLDELARNRCGKRYQQARRNSGFGSSIFGGLFGSDDYQERRRNIEPDQIQPYATYRTMCVRLCDGYYFPVSFSALPSKFGADDTACQDRCAAPTQLFVYRNPGAEIEQMISPDGGMPYSKLPNAWKFKKQFVKGCSCKATEYKPEGEAESKTAENSSGKSEDTAGFETTVESEPLENLDDPKKQTSQEKSPQTKQ